ncbi:hypothetical protein NLJ89_g8410 [Agrocybe chaxingu]|uniref:Anaphase-promoting complex subunit 1 n=1 Tax=Agrocybe chaxingu TaxID=84603 RepID=A0A9W8MSS6_9AGAR|nr:hypothetical protein NLJ89_g8410 [Agrocybe chaxingu]
MPPLAVSVQGPPISAAVEFITRVSPKPEILHDESPLLKQIKTALRGIDPETVAPVNTARCDASSATNSNKRELVWNMHHAVLSSGGVMVKRWSFEQEGEHIQYACIGELEQVIIPHSHSAASVHSAANYTKGDSNSSTATEQGRPIFSSFIQAKREPEKIEMYTAKVPAVFVFLRSICKIYLEDGVDYTFSLPFIVRKAWPAEPSGVMVQRVLDPAELKDAEATGEDVLSTIFSVTSPFTEANVVGLTEGILRATKDEPVKLKDVDEHEQTKKAYQEHPTHRAPRPLTVNLEMRQISLWEYVYIKPKNTLVQSKKKTEGDNDATTDTKKRRSLTGLGLAGSSNDLGLGGPAGRGSSIHPAMSPTLEFFELPDAIPLSSLPGMPSTLPTATTLGSLVSQPPPMKGRRNSLSRNDLSMTMDRMALGGRLDTDGAFLPPDLNRFRPAYWMQRLLTHRIDEEDAQAWQNIQVSVFDNRFDGKNSRCFMAVRLPTSKILQIFSITKMDDRTTQATPVSTMPALCATSLRATRGNVWDLLVIKAQGQLVLLTHGLREVPVELQYDAPRVTEMDMDISMTQGHGAVIAACDTHWGTTTLIYEDGWKTCVTFDIFPQNKLVTEVLQLLALTLPTEVTFDLHRLFLEKWSTRAWSTARNVEFECLASALYTVFGLTVEEAQETFDPWLRLAHSTSHEKHLEDPILRRLRRPPMKPLLRPVHTPGSSHPMLAPLLYGLHTLAEHLRLSIHRQADLLKFAPVICRIAAAVRPEWADYWKRLVPDAIGIWPSAFSTQAPEQLDDRIPVWPPDMSAILYGRVSTPDWKVPWHDIGHIVSRFSITPSLEYGGADPLAELHELSMLYNTLSDGKITDCQKRAENVVYKMVTKKPGRDITANLPLGIASPLREAVRTCQLAPPGDWPLDAYKAIGRNDLAASAIQMANHFNPDGYQPRKEFISIGEIAANTRIQVGDMDNSGVSGVEMNLKQFTAIRFGLDRRIEEVSRMLCSSIVPNIKGMERPDMNDHEQTKDHQTQVLRTAERTFALPYGRALFTFATMPVINREAFVIPKLENSIRLQPLNVLVTPEPGKISPESICWGEFHNGVATALKITATATGVESSWIAFNKPSDLSPEHAGFLLGLGLTGHLKGLMTWHTFSYLTPKHDLTSIGLLLGMSVANVGSGNIHITKLLSVHTPALLPVPADLNVPLITQAAGLSGLGLLYLGTKNRRMAEVALGQISRRDLVQPDLSNEHREAYTYSSALAFGMIMLGKGTDIPVDNETVKRLNVLIHGNTRSALEPEGPKFDINLTSPAASMALALMYFRTNKRDIAESITIPDTAIALNSIQPYFLLIRTIARSIIMWDHIKPTNEWLTQQIPLNIRLAIESRTKTGNPIDDTFDLAYYNILAGACFVIGLKYAGTAGQDAYQIIVRNYDMFSRLAYSNGPQFDHKIKRSVVRDGLNLLSIALCMVMAGTGEITCMRRLRYAFGMSQQLMMHHGFKYGTHVSTHIALGLLFLGGGRFTLGSSDAAVVSLITAFFPRFHHVSSDNRCYLQALRHLWVLAVEPRCLIARDVDTNEVVYLPVKISTDDNGVKDQVQLISPTLIPDLEKVVAIRVDTPRYWPFYLDTAAHPRHKEALLKSQVLYVKRRTAFLSYTEDPRGSRSLFVRSGSSSGDAATLDFPQLTDAKTHPAGDLGEFITSFSNDVLFLAFADHFSRSDNDTDEERLFHTYCHAALLDSILQDKPQTLQSHLTLYMYRNMSPNSRYFHLRLQDLRFAADFYAKVYDRQFSGRTENNPRPGLLRDTTVQGTLHALDRKLDLVRILPGLVAYMGCYVQSGVLPDVHNPEFNAGPEPYLDVDGGLLDGRTLERYAAWYLLRNGVPVSTLLLVLRQLAADAHRECLTRPHPEGTTNAQALDVGIKEVLHASGTRMTTSLGSGWSIRSLNEIIEVWSFFGPT